MESEQVILVDTLDQQVGVAGKVAAHEQGLLHRAFSIFIFDKEDKLLLQQRAVHKYHSGGLWTNTCCSHPLPGEDTAKAAQRRLIEEMGFITPMEKIFDFVYKTEFKNGLTEYEFDHVFVGEYSGPVTFNTDEVKAVSHRSIEEIRLSIENDPEMFTSWFLLAFPKIEEWWKDRNKHKIA